MEREKKKEKKRKFHAFTIYNCQRRI